MNVKNIVYAFRLQGPRCSRTTAARIKRFCCIGVQLMVIKLLFIFQSFDRTNIRSEETGDILFLLYYTRVYIITNHILIV